MAATSMVTAGTREIWPSTYLRYESQVSHMSNNIRVLHYLNQFFGGIGGEEHANVPPEVQDGPVGPGRLLQSMLQAAGGGAVVATVVCGDNYIVENEHDAIDAIGRHIRPLQARPGRRRSGVRCGGATVWAARLFAGQPPRRGIPAITGMHPENTGVLTHRLQITAVPTRCGGVRHAARNSSDMVEL